MIRRYWGDRVRTKNWVAFLFTLWLGLALVGCGQLNATQMVKQLQSVQSGMNSYKSTAFMTVHIQDGIQRYYVETWYQAPNLYRIALGNENKDISQIIVHNAQGIYLISPGVKRVIRFQGDWAERQGHLYLYHSLLSKILAVAEPQYSVKDKVVSFMVPTDPLNPLISSQKVELEQGSYAPKQIILYDKAKQPVITMTYLTFQKGVTFDAGAFSPDQATTLKAIEMPVSTVEQGFGVIEPTFVPTNDSLEDESELNGTVYVRYTGPEPFTIVESRPQPGGLDLGAGQLLTLYGVPAVLIGSGGVHQMYWLHRGVEFQLTSDMKVSDMIQVAASTLGDYGK